MLYKFLWCSSSNSIRVNADAVSIPTAASVNTLPICPKNNLLRQVFDYIFKASSQCKEHAGHCCKLSFERHATPPLFPFFLKFQRAPVVDHTLLKPVGISY